MGKKESKVEKHLKVQTEGLNGLCYKFTSPGRKGVPDRLCVFPGNIILFVETKAPNGTLSPSQKREIKLIKSKDSMVAVATTKQQVDTVISIVKGMINGQ